MLEKMILSPREGVSEWGNREKVAKKKKMRNFFRDFNSPDGNELVPNLQIRQRFLPKALFRKVGEVKASSDLQICHYFTSLVPLDPRELSLTESVEFAPHSKLQFIYRLTLFWIFSKNFNGAIKNGPD
jgi:hypothetical protein